MKTNPLVSFCLFAYNQEAYVKEAVESALKQTYSPLEIIISDDCSSDATFQIIQDTVKAYTGPHKVILNRNVKNLGLGQHFSEVCGNMSAGDYIVVLGGDDISKEEHVEIAIECIEDNPDVPMIDFNGQIINSEGKELGIYQKLTFDKRKFSLADYLNLKPISSFAPGRIFKRSLISEFDPISANCPTEDSVLVLRSLLLGGFTRVNKSLVSYRTHDNNLSSSGSLRRVSDIAIIAQYYLDIFKLFNEKKIDDAACDLLMERINLEYNFRKTTYKQKENTLGSIKDRAYLKLLRLSYSRHAGDQK
jgi:glycosyltransferase involved in cell wall biosynthesis